MLKKMKSYWKNWHYPTAFFIGLAVFLCIYGFEPLRVTGIGWTLHGYDNNDITQHQTGWMYFRNSPWTFPICKALYLGYPEGTSIAFTDSIPLAALIFKLLSPILPEKFQYFGLYTCFCFMMQGVFATALLYHFNKNRVFSCIGSLIFIFASSFLERCFRHTALSSHWLLLAGLLLYFVRRKNYKKYNYTVLWMFLLCTAIGIHPYLFAMVYGLFIVSEWSFFGINHSWKSIISEFILCSLTCFLWGYILGVFGQSIKPAPGFGMYNLNLNALFNAESKYHNVWTASVQNRPLYSSQGDGIYYLGMPMLILFLSAAAFVIFSKKIFFHKMIKEHYPLITLIIAFTIFAISNVVTFDNKILVSFPLPVWLLKIFNIFRASERFFLISYYCIMLFSLSILYRLGNKTIAVIVIGVIAALQIYDIHPGLRDLHYNFESRKIGIRFSEDWKNIADRYQSAISFETITDRNLSFWLAQNKFQSNIMISAEIHRDQYWEEKESEWAQMKSDFTTGHFIPNANTVYIISDIPSPNSSFKTKEELESFLNILRTDYAATAEIKYLDYTKNNEKTGYWFFCPRSSLAILR